MLEEKMDIQDAKVDIQDAKVDIRDIKVDIENILSEKGSDFSVKTTAYIHRLFEKFGLDGIFGNNKQLRFSYILRCNDGNVYL